METDVALETLPERVRGWKNKKILENWKNSKDKYFIFFLYYFIKLIGKPKFSKACTSLSFPLPFSFRYTKQELWVILTQCQSINSFLKDFKMT